MKKLKLNLKDVGEILTREQLKQVYGGSDEGQLSCSVCYAYDDNWGRIGSYSVGFQGLTMSQCMHRMQEICGNIGVACFSYDCF